MTIGPLTGTIAAASPYFLPTAQIPPTGKTDYGGKATNLASLHRLGLPVPASVTFGTAFIGQLLDGELTEDLTDIHSKALSVLEGAADVVEGGLRFGDPQRPLVVSVRPGAAKGMPHVLPTIQGVGLNDEIAEGWGSHLSDMTAVLSFYLKYLVQFGIYVRGLRREALMGLLRGERTENSIKGRIREAREIIRRGSNGNEIPADPWMQLREVFSSVASAWNSQDALDYRRRYEIPDRPTVAVTIQRQVLGTLARSLAGVIYSRDPQFGESGLFGRYVVGGTGDQIMTGGSQTPISLQRLSLEFSGVSDRLKSDMRWLERELKGPVECELIVERGVLWYLQCRPLTTISPVVGLKIFLRMHTEGLVTEESVVGAVDEEGLCRALMSPSFVRPDDLGDRVLCRGTTWSWGAAVGKIIFNVQKLLAQPPFREWILVMPGGVDIRLWEEIFRRTAGIVTFGYPGAHFFPRAVQAGVPVISEIGETHISAAEGDVVSLDALHPDGYVARGRLETRPREIGRFLAGEVPEEEIKGKRARELARQIERYRGMKDGVHQKTASEDPSEAAGRLLEKEDLSLYDLRETILQRGWGTRRKEEEDRHGDYSLGQPAAALMSALYHQDASRLARLFLKCIGSHSFTVALFGALPAELRAGFLDRFVEEVRKDDGKPGYMVYALTRMVTYLREDSKDESRDEMVPLLRGLDPQTLNFFKTEVELLFDPVDSDIRGVLYDISDRFPGVEEGSIRDALKRAFPG